MNTDKLVGNLIAEWLSKSENRKTIVFAASVAHSVHIRNEFRRLGIAAEHIDGRTPKQDRDDIIGRLKSDEVKIVSNYGVLTEGFDCKDVGCVMLARPTTQMWLYRQMGGRGLRSAPGKTDVIIIDHAGATRRHGWLEDRVEWILDPTRKAINKTQAQYEATGKDRFIECSQCGLMREGGKHCPHCGFIPPEKAKDFKMAEGELGLLERDGTVKPTIYDPETRRQWHRMFVHIASERGRSKGWVSNTYKEKFGGWPGKPWDPLPPPIEPTSEVRSWVRSRDIAYARSRS